VIGIALKVHHRELSKFRQQRPPNASLKAARKERSGITRLILGEGELFYFFSGMLGLRRGVGFFP
jgi:hypothetical protein